MNESSLLGGLIYTCTLKMQKYGTLEHVHGTIWARLTLVERIRVRLILTSLSGCVNTALIWFNFSITVTEMS